MVVPDYREKVALIRQMVEHELGCRDKDTIISKAQELLRKATALEKKAYGDA